MKSMLQNLEDDIRVLKSKKGYIKAGYPGFMGLFGRDSLITAWQLFDYDPLIARNTFLALANLQGKKTVKTTLTGEEPGKILHEYYPEDMNTADCMLFEKHKSQIKWLKPGRPVYFSVDSTLLFLSVLRMYYSKTKDNALWDSLRTANVISSANNWIVNNLAKYEGLIGYEKTEALAHQSWKDSSSYKIKYPVFPIEVQGYAHHAQHYKSEILEEFWMPSEKYYCFALDGDRKPVEVVTSNPGHLLYTGILDQKPKIVKLIVKKLFSDEMWTPYGIRTLAVNDEWFDAFSYHNGAIWPHDNWIIAQGLKRYGYKRRYNQIKNALYHAYNELLGYIPEYYGVTVNNQLLKLPACHPQAWASGALLNFALEEGEIK